MSDVTDGVSFMTLFDQDLVSVDQLDDFVDAWHDSGAADDRSLARFLGMTDDEYAVCTMAPETLPMIRTARRSGHTLHAALRSWLRGKSGDANAQALAAWLLTHADA